MKTLTVKIPDTVAYKLTEETIRQKTSQSCIVREALSVYFVNLEQTKAPKKASFLDAAKDLCGCDKGPADLSTHKKHWEGYGE